MQKAQEGPACQDRSDSRKHNNSGTDTPPRVPARLYIGQEDRLAREGNRSEKAEPSQSLELQQKHWVSRLFLAVIVGSEKESGF
jgi:hypothetical protein